MTLVCTAWGFLLKTSCGRHAVARETCEFEELQTFMLPGISLIGRASPKGSILPVNLLLRAAFYINYLSLRGLQTVTSKVTAAQWCLRARFVQRSQKWDDRMEHTWQRTLRIPESVSERLICSLQPWMLMTAWPARYCTARLHGSQDSKTLKH